MCTKKLPPRSLRNRWSGGLFHPRVRRCRANLIFDQLAIPHIAIERELFGGISLKLYHNDPIPLHCPRTSIEIFPDFQGSPIWRGQSNDRATLAILPSPHHFGRLHGNTRNNAGFEILSRRHGTVRQTERAGDQKEKDLHISFLRLIHAKRIQAFFSMRRITSHRLRRYDFAPIISYC